MVGGVLSRWYRITGRGEPTIISFLWFDHVLDVREVLWYRKEVAGLFIVEEFSPSHHGENFSRCHSTTASARAPHDVSALALRGH